MTQLSPHFTLEEFTRSGTAKRLGIANIPNGRQIRNMKYLCVTLLEPLRSALRSKVHPKAVVVITSGFRVPALNLAVGGVKTSQHPKGEAADIRVDDDEGRRLLTPQELFDFIVAEGLPYHQIINEYDEWVHVSLKPLPVAFQARQKLWVYRDKGGVHWAVSRPAAMDEIRPAP